MHLFILISLLLSFTIVYIMLFPSVKIPTSASETKFFSEAELKRLKSAYSYHRISRMVSFASFVCRLLLLLFFLLGFGKRLETYLFNPSHPVLSAVLFFCLLYLAYFLLSLPFSYISGVVIERRYGFLKMSGLTWFLRYLKSSGITFLLGVMLVAVMFFLIKRFGEYWWIPSTGVFLVVSLAIAFVSPILIEPLFAKFRPLEDEALHKSLVDIAHKAGFRVKEILICDESLRTTHTNAYFSGVGMTRRIVLYDTLLSEFQPNEVCSVVAHEVGHAKHRHIVKGLLLSWFGIAAFFCFLALLLIYHRNGGEIRFLYQPRVVAFFAFWALSISFISSPLNNLMSRHMEAEADIEAVRLTDDVDSLISVQKKLALSNLSELHPHLLVYVFFFSHPTALQRIALAEQHRE